MRRRILLYILLLAIGAQAQEKYSEVLARTRTLSPYEAIYELMDYQQWKPELPGVYFELGNLSYDLLPTRDPLHHYRELSTLLYRSKLFYGNCLHFAKDQKLPGWQYELIAQGQKKIEYNALEWFIRPRLEEIQRQKIACDSIHSSFLRMTARYDRCRSLFANFMKQYTREKTAHLQLQPSERSMLMELLLAADSLETDIAQYQQALTLQAVPGYHPVFRKEPIVLYRLDGLTYTDFLQNDIVIWDYKKWVLGFLYEQKHVYEALYEEVARALKTARAQVQQYEAGRPISGTTDGALIGRCERLEITTPQVDSLRMLQETLRNAVAEQTIAQSATPASIRELAPLLLIAAERKDAQPDNALRLMQQHLIDMARPLRIQHQPTYTSPVSGETMRVEVLPREEVFCLLPDETGFRCVVTDIDGAVHIRHLTSALIEDQAPVRFYGEQPLVMTKIPGNQWVLITNKEVHFLP